MKLLRYGPKGGEKPGMLDAEGHIRDLSGVIPDITGETLSPKSLAELAATWDRQGQVEEAAAEVAGFLRSGGSRAELIAELGHALLQEDAGFHWFQIYEAGVRQALAWPDGSEPSLLVLVAVARFLAAHTPTRRELATVVARLVQRYGGIPAERRDPEHMVGPAAAPPEVEVEVRPCGADTQLSLL